MINRRELLKQMAWITAGSMMAKDASAFTSDVKNKKVGVQLYTIRNEITKDAKGSIKRVAELGFGEVENFGYNGKFFGMTAAEYKMLLNDLGLTAPSGHYMYGNFGNRQVPGTLLYGWEKAVEDAKAIGQQYMVIAYLMPDERKSLDDYKKIAADLNKAGEICKKAGIQLGYHNHEFEFQEMSGQIPFDILTKETDSKLVTIELDLYWASFANQSPVDLFNKHKGRIALWHVKDMDKTPKRNFTEVGNGQIDFASIFKNAKASGMKHFFVEQDVCPGSPFDSISKSIGHIKSNLLNYL
jgi:sugar phosphate isomerase/epimerase